MYAGMAQVPTMYQLNQPRPSSFQRCPVCGGHGFCYTVGGSSEGVETPHFYQVGRLIVLCVGENEEITAVLEELLGTHFRRLGHGPV